MSEINAPATLVTPGGTIQFNNLPASSYYFFNDVSGLDQAPLRTATDPKPHAPGLIIHPSLRDGRHITLTGQVVATSTAQRNTMTDALKAALESIESVDGTYSWTPTGQGLHSLTVRCDIGVTYSGSLGPILKNFTFGLVAADPAISGG